MYSKSLWIKASAKCINVNVTMAKVLTDKAAAYVENMLMSFRLTFPRTFNSACYENEISPETKPHLNHSLM